MPDESKRVDDYIARAAPFARPILERIRKVVHRACPEIEERIKWGVPSFEKDGLVCGVAAFKAHATFGFWRGAELDDPGGILRGKEKASFMAEKLTDVSQLPPDEVLADYVPADLAAALKRNARARTNFGKFSPSNRREYVTWITEAKREETRLRRLAQAIEWMEAGKPRDWKYQSR